MSTPGAEFVEVFLQEASEHLQFLREYSAILQDPYPVPEDIDRLYISAHTLGGTSASYGYPLFSEVSGKIAHIFQYAMNATIGPEAAGPLVEFISEGVAVLESDLIMISTNNVEADEEIDSFKIKYPFAFQAPAQPVAEPEAAPISYVEHQPEHEFAQEAAPEQHYGDDLSGANPVAAPPERPPAAQPAVALRGGGVSIVNCLRQCR